MSIFRLTDTAVGISAASATFIVMLVAQALAGPMIISSALDTGLATVLNSDTASQFISTTESAPGISTASNLDSGAAVATNIADIRNDIVADVGSNSDYSADISNFAQSKSAYVASETNQVGSANLFGAPTTPGDGSAGAAVGVPQVPALLDGYAVRAPWQVAGVDYAVGISARTVLKNPLTMNVVGVSVDKINHVAQITGDNVSLDGWSFKGWRLSVTGKNATVTNSDFTNGVLRFEPGSSNGTIMYNLFDQKETKPDTAPFIAFGSGKFVVAYNDFENSYHMHAQFTHGNGQSQTIIFQFNLLQNAGGGSAAGAHGDFIQLFGIPTVKDLEIKYNTVVQNKPGYNTQGWSIGYDQQTILAGSISNNTMVVPGATNSRINYAVILNSHWINGTFTVANNYIDPRGIIGSYILTNDQWPGPYHNGTIVTSNDVNMVTGNYISTSRSTGKRR